MLSGKADSSCRHRWLIDGTALAWPYGRSSATGVPMPITRRLLLGSSLTLPTFRAARAASSVLRIGISTSLSTLDPMMTTTGDEYIYDNIVFNGLTRMDETLAVK